jgi:hypothetical protein
VLKAIETQYKGYRFRSRLEARWAVFFDALGVPWEYEKEGYDLDGVWYLPDFWLPTAYDRIGRQGIWIEIKGQHPTEEENKRCEMLALYTMRSVVTLVGTPTTHEEGWCGIPNGSDGYYQWTYYNDSDRDTDGGSSPEGVGWDNWMRWHWCSVCRVTKVEFNNDYFTCPQCKQDTCIPFNPHINNAVNTARSARFEHGKQP